MLRILILAIGLLSVAAALAQDKVKQQNASEVHQLFIQDQWDRGAELGDEKPGSKRVPLTGEQMQANDAARRKRVREMMEQKLLTTGNDFHDAAFIFQHGSEPEDYLLAHVLAMVAVSKGDASARWIAAATLDRYLQSTGEAQIFGTQYLTAAYKEYLRQKKIARETGYSPCHAGPGEMCPPTAQAASAPGAQKPASGDEYTLEPYTSALVPDSLRQEYCVGPVAEQKKNVEEFNQKKELSRQPIPGCGR